MIELGTFNDGILIGILIGIPTTLLIEHWLLRPLVRWQTRLFRTTRRDR